MKYLGRIINAVIYVDDSIRQDNMGCGMSGPPRIKYSYTIVGSRKEFDSEYEAKAYIRKLKKNRKEQLK